METAPEGAVSAIVVLVECVTGISSSPFLLGLAGRNVNGDSDVDGGGLDNNRRDHHSNSVFLYVNYGDGPHRRW